MLLWNLWLEIALELLYNGCHVVVPCAYVHAGLPPWGADRIGMVSSALLAAAAACVALLSLATRSRKW